MAGPYETKAAIQLTPVLRLDQAVLVLLLLKGGVPNALISDPSEIRYPYNSAG